MTKKEHRAVAWGHWHAVSKGFAGPETAAWLTETATKLLAANNIKDENKRRLKIVRIVGLLGEVDFNARAIREILAIPERTFPDRIVGDSPKAKAERHARKRRLIRLACNLPDSAISDAALDARIRRATNSGD